MMYLVIAYRSVSRRKKIKTVEKDSKIAISIKKSSANGFLLLAVLEYIRDHSFTLRPDGFKFELVFNSCP